MFCVCSECSIRFMSSFDSCLLWRWWNINSVWTDKLLSLLPEYVVPYTIHLLAHDPDYVKVQDIEQLKEIKE